MSWIRAGGVLVSGIVLFQVSAWAKLRCFDARAGGRDVVACIQTPGDDGHAQLEEQFDRSTRNLLRTRYLEKQTFGTRPGDAKESIGHLHTSRPNQATCTVFEKGKDGQAIWDEPVFTMKAFWQEESHTLPSHDALASAWEKASEKLDFKKTVEIGELAISRRAELGIKNIRTLGIAMALFGRTILDGKQELVLTTRAHASEQLGSLSAEHSPWVRLYRHLGFETVGNPLRHPRYPSLWSTAMHQRVESMKARLKRELEGKNLWVSEEEIPTARISLQTSPGELTTRCIAGELRP